MEMGLGALRGLDFRRAAAIGEFLSWLENLDCGTDLLGPADYRIPRRSRDEFGYLVDSFNQAVLISICKHPSRCLPP